MMAERLSVTKKCCLNCKEFPTYGSVCSPFDVDQATFSCSGHLFDREDLLRRATAIETENADLRAQLEARESQRAAERLPKDGDELQALLNKAYRKGNDDAHAAHAVMSGTQLEAQRGGAVVVPDDKFTLDLDESLDHKLARITINSEARGVGYDLCGRVGDGRFSRRTYDITPYIKHCLDTIGIQPIPADRVLAEGMVGVDREEWDLLGRLHMVAMQFVMDADPAQRRSAAHLVQAVAALRQYTGRAQQAKGE